MVRYPLIIRLYKCNYLLRMIYLCWYIYLERSLLIIFNFNIYNDAADLLANYDISPLASTN